MISWWVQEFNDFLVGPGIKIFIGHSKRNISKATMLVKSTAIKKNNAELAEGRKKRLPIYERAEMLANIVALKKKYYSDRISWKNHHNVFSS